MNFAEFLAGNDGLTLEIGLPLTPAPPRRSAFLGMGLTVAATTRATRLLPHFSPRLVAPVVIVVIVISGRHGLAIIVVVLPDDGVEPFSNRHAGPARGVPGSFARFWTEASEIPRTARFHLRAKPLREERDGPVLSGGSLTDEAEGAVFCPRR